MRKPRLVRRLLLLAVAFALALGLAEILLRMLGVGVYVPPDQRPGESMVVDPPGPLFAIDPDIGHRHIPGTQRIKLGDIAWTQTHEPDGTRRMNPSHAGPEKAPEIWAFGCSFTHGFGVSDAETYVARLQQKHPDWQLVNFGIDGASDVQMLLLLERELERRPPPAWVIWGYLDEHEIRNVMSRAWRRGFLSRMQNRRVELPYGCLVDEKLVIKRRPLEYSPLPGAKWLSLMNLADKVYNRFENETHHPRAVSNAVLARVAETCRAKDIRLLVAYLRGERSDLAELCASWKADFVDARLDGSDPNLILSPSDLHPSSKGHEAMAEAIERHLRLGK